MQSLYLSKEDIDMSSSPEIWMPASCLEVMPGASTLGPFWALLSVPPWAPAEESALPETHEWEFPSAQVIIAWDGFDWKNWIRALSGQGFPQTLVSTEYFQCVLPLALQRALSIMTQCLVLLLGRGEMSLWGEPELSWSILGVKCPSHPGHRSMVDLSSSHGHLEVQLKIISLAETKSWKYIWETLVKKFPPVWKGTFLPQLSLCLEPDLAFWVEMPHYQIPRPSKGSWHSSVNLKLDLGRTKMRFYSLKFMEFQ